MPPLVHSTVRENLKRCEQWQTEEGFRLFQDAMLQDLAMRRVSRDEALAALNEARPPAIPALTLETVDATALIAEAAIGFSFPINDAPRDAPRILRLFCEFFLEKVALGKGHSGLLRSLREYLRHLREFAPDDPLIERARSLGLVDDDV